LAIPSPIARTPLKNGLKNSPPLSSLPKEPTRSSPHPPTLSASMVQGDPLKPLRVWATFSRVSSRVFSPQATLPTMPHDSPSLGTASPPTNSRTLAVQPSSPPTSLPTFLLLGVL
jgi:hypothetical protein